MGGEVMQEEEHHSLGEVHSFEKRWRLSESNREHGARALEVSPPDPQLISKFQSLSQAASTLVILVGAFVLLGGILGFANMNTRSEERRVGKECRSRWWWDHYRQRENRKRCVGVIECAHAL